MLSQMNKKTTIAECLIIAAERGFASDKDILKSIMTQISWDERRTWIVEHLQMQKLANCPAIGPFFPCMNFTTLSFHYLSFWLCEHSENYMRTMTMDRNSQHLNKMRKKNSGVLMRPDSRKVSRNRPPGKNSLFETGLCLCWNRAVCHMQIIRSRYPEIRASSRATDIKCRTPGPLSCSASWRLYCTIL